jgi:hypothetical protein
MKKESVLLLIFLSVLGSCKDSKLPKFKLCTTLGYPSFWCADQRLPQEKEGVQYPYSPGWVCMPPEDFKIITDHMISREKYINTLENRSCNP